MSTPSPTAPGTSHPFSSLYGHIEGRILNPELLAADFALGRHGLPATATALNAITAHGVAGTGDAMRSWQLLSSKRGLGALRVLRDVVLNASIDDDEHWMIVRCRCVCAAHSRAGDRRPALGRQ